MASQAKGDGEIRLARYLNSLVKPSQEVIVSPFTPSDSDDGLSEVIDLILGCCDFSNLPEWLAEDERTEMKTFMPVSPLPPWSVWASEVEDEWNEPINFNPDQSIRDQAVSNLLDVLRGRKIRSAKYERAANELDLTTNSGLPYFERRSAVIEDALMMALASQRVGHNLDDLPFVLGSRAKPDPEGPKRRAIYMAPMSNNIMEKALQIPIVPYLKQKTGWFASWDGPEAVDVALKKTLDMLQGQDQLTQASIDYSGFDRRVSAEKLFEVRSLLFELFWEHDALNIEMAFSNCMDNGVITPGGFIPSTGDRVKSGWGLTNLVDSLIAVIDAEYFYLRIGEESLVKRFPNMPYLQVNGDDVTFPVPDHVTEELIADIYAEHGAVMNPVKQRLSSELIRFNSRNHHASMDRGVRSLVRAFRGLFYPERYSALDKFGQALRAIMILHTLESHPHYEVALREVIQLDKKLGLGTFGNDQLYEILAPSNIERVSEELRIDRPGRLVATGQTLRGLNDWQVVDDLSRMIL
jgi:hypothetical protein